VQFKKSVLDCLLMIAVQMAAQQSVCIYVDVSKGLSRVIVNTTDMNTTEMERLSVADFFDSCVRVVIYLCLTEPCLLLCYCLLLI